MLSTSCRPYLFSSSSSKETKPQDRENSCRQAQVSSSSMADFSPNNSLLLKMPSHSPNFSSLLFYGQNHGEAAPANANAAAAVMVEDASLESSSAVVDTSPQDSASPMERKRKATEDSATLSSAQSKVVATSNLHTQPPLPFFMQHCSKEKCILVYRIASRRARARGGRGPTRRLRRRAPLKMRPPRGTSM